MNKTILMIQNISSMNAHERLELIHSIKVSEKILNYLKFKLQNLSIEILGKYKGNIIELMNSGLLEGWCWQTTESAIVFLEDDDYIERGNLKFGTHKEYWHSWISFTFQNEKFIFDPCLKTIAEKDIYYYIFEVSVEGRVTAKNVREELIYRINNPIKKSYNTKRDKLVEELFASYRSKKNRTEIYISGNDDVNSPMYRNETGYNATIQNGKIINLIAHYYHCGI